MSLPATPHLTPENEARIQAALDALEQQISVARVTNDPLLHMLEALAATVRAQHRMFVDAADTIARAIDEGRRPLSPAEMTALQQAATIGFADHAGAFVRATNLRTALIAAGVLVGTALVALGGGYVWGHRVAAADMRETEAGLQAAFSRGPEAAKDWRALMTWNDPRKALAQCQGQTLSVQEGRRVCAVPLWIESPPPPPGR